MRTFVYVDGFNLYYSLRHTDHKWLDLEALCRDVIPESDVARIHYFTARVKPFPDDPQQPQRQDVYLRALGTLKTVRIHFGQFSIHERRLPLSRAAGTLSVGDRVWTTKAEEKGSDVNLATRLLVEGHGGEYERAVVVTNDTDLVEPVRYVSGQLGLDVLIMNARPRPAARLVRVADGHRLITYAAMGRAQFPEELRDAGGRTIRRPGQWAPSG